MNPHSPLSRPVGMLLLVSVLACAALTICSVSTLQAAARKSPTQKELKQQRNAAGKEIARARKQISNNEVRIADALRRLQSLDAEMATTQTTLDSLTRLGSQLSAKSTRLKEEINHSEESLEQLRAAYLRQIKHMRLHRGQTSGLAFLFSSKDFNQGLQRWRYMRQMVKWRTRRTDEIGAHMALLNRQNSELESTIATQTATTNKTRLQRNALADGRKQQQQLATELRADNEGLQRVVQQKNAEIASLDRQTAALIAAAQRQEQLQRKAAEKRRQEEKRRQQEAEQQRREQQQRQEEQRRRELAAQPQNQPAKPAAKPAAKPSPKPASIPEQTYASAGGSKVSYAEARGRRPRSQQQSPQNLPKPENSQQKKTKPSAAAPAGGSGFASQRGHLPCPVAGTFHVTIPYGQHSRPDMPKVTLDNTGIDAEVSPGATVKTVYDGQVAAIYKAQGFGTVVLVRHGDYYTVYANLSHASVKNGQKLKQGQSVGAVGSGQKPTLHFEIWKQRTRLNPQEWLR